MGAANPALQGRPADHNTGQMVAPNDCSICHTTANWNSNALPAGHMPNPGNAACTVCHTDVTNYKTLACESGPAYGHHRQLRHVPRRYHGADLVQQLRSEGRVADALAYPLSLRGRLQFLPRHELRRPAASAPPT